MKVGIISDIHSNIRGLQAGLDRMGEIDELLCAGDVLLQYRWSDEVVRALRDLDAKIVLGNHDQVLLGPSGERALSRPDVDAGLVDWMRSHPGRRDLDLGGRHVLMTHSSPWGEAANYVYPHSPSWNQAAALDCDVLIVGHTHFKMAERFGNVLVINPGSAGDPRDHRNRFQLSCATWDTGSNEVRFYDYEDPARVAVLQQ